MRAGEVVHQPDGAERVLGRPPRRGPDGAARRRCRSWPSRCRGRSPAPRGTRARRRRNGAARGRPGRGGCAASAGAAWPARPRAGNASAASVLPSANSSVPSSRFICGVRWSASAMGPSSRRTSASRPSWKYASASSPRKQRLVRLLGVQLLQQRRGLGVLRGVDVAGREVEPRFGPRDLRSRRSAFSSGGGDVAQLHELLQRRLLRERVDLHLASGACPRRAALARPSSSMRSTSGGSTKHCTSALPSMSLPIGQAEQREDRRRDVEQLAP